MNNFFPTLFVFFNRLFSHRSGIYVSIRLIFITVSLLIGCGVAKAQVTLTATVGTGSGSFTTLKEAFDAINAGTHQGAIGINITGNTTETASAVLNASGTGSASYTSVVITPSGARTITGAITGHLIDLNGADNVTIDGLNSGGNSLVISNSATGASSTLRFINDASNNIIQNCTLQGSTTSLGVVFFSTGTTTGNDGNNINNCAITVAGSNFPIYGIYSLGTDALIDNSGNTINANSISDFFSAGSATCGININSFNSTWTISNNKLFQTASRTFTNIFPTINTHSAIAVSSGNGYDITGNTIGYASASGTGVYTMDGTGQTRFIGINLAVGTTTASSVQGNTITAISLNTSNSSNTANGILCGINLNAGNVNVGNLAANTIGASSGVDVIRATSTGANGAVVGINCSSTGTIVIQNNVFGGLTSSGITAAVSGYVFGINVSGFVSGTSMNISNNTIGNATSDNMRGGTLGVTTGSSQVAGILFGLTYSNVLINNNTIRNLSSYGTGSSGYVRGIMTSFTTSSSAQGWTISNNTISNLTTNSTLPGTGNGSVSALGIHHASSLGCTISQNTISNISNINTNSTGNNVVAGISLAGTTTSTTLITSVTRNRIFGLSNSGIGVNSNLPPIITGILVRAGNNIISIANNMISLGNGQSTNTTIIGIWSINFSAPIPISTNIYHNTVNIEGTATSGALSTFAYLRGDLNTTSRIGTVDIRNNIFNNIRTGGEGGHYAISNNFGANTVSATGWGVNASNFNVLNAASGTIGYWASARTFSGWRTASASDSNSLSEVSVPFVNTATGDLHMNYSTTPTQLESGGTTLAAITSDFDNNARPGPSGSVNGGAVFSDIGADEFDGVPLNIFCTNPTDGGIIAAEQSGSSPFDPSAFTSTTGASGQTGTLEYKWQSSTTSSTAGFSDIASSNSATYDEGSLSQTTWFKRLARVTCSTDWTGAAESNVLRIAINSALPVNLSSFTAKPTPDNKVSLAWVTSTEQVNKGFRIERQAGSVNGKFEQIGFVGSNAKDGNSQNTLAYSFIDAKPAIGIASFYRLVQEDLDGKLTYSEVRMVKLNGESVSMVFPNPSNGLVNISRTADGKRMNIQVMDQSGKIIFKAKNITEPNYTINIPQSGVYTIKMIYPETGEQSIQRVVVQK